MSLLGSLYLGARATEANRLGLQVAGDNIANVNTPGYVRQEADFSPVLPSRYGNVVVGNGVTATGVQRKIETFLQDRARRAGSQNDFQSARSQVIRRIEAVAGELGENDISSAFSEFTGAINATLGRPEDVALRGVAVDKGKLLASRIVEFRQRIDEIDNDTGLEIEASVRDINASLERVESLNRQIVALEAASPSEAGSLRTIREQELAKLSSKIDVRTFEQPNGRVNVYNGNDYLLVDGAINRVEVLKETEDGRQQRRLIFSESKGRVAIDNGRIGGLQSVRDDEIPAITDRLDAFTATLVEQFNRLHSSGQGLRGVSSWRGESTNDDPTAVLTSVSAGYRLPINNGGFEIRLTSGAAGGTTTRLIDVDLDGVGADDSLNSIVSKINTALGSTVASVDSQGRLLLTAPPGGSIAFGADSSGFLGAAGVNTFFTGFDSRTIGVSATLAADPARFAASGNYAVGDVSNARRLAAFGTDRPAAFEGATVEEYYASFVGDIGSKSEAANLKSESAKTTKDALESELLAMSGVSLDEETLKLIQFQNGFQASARYISTVNQMLEEIINILR